MSDFDTVLERLMVDPGFRAALAADPGRALAGYRLSPDEIELLHAQVEAGSGGNRQVEQRTSKASLFGLLSPLAGAVGLGGDEVGAGNIGKSIGLGGHPPGSAGFAAAGAGAGVAEAGTAGFGAAADAGFGAQTAGFGAQTAGFGGETAGFGADTAGFGADGAGFGTQTAGVGADTGGFGVPTGGFGADSAGFGGSGDARLSDVGDLAGQIGRPMDQPDGGLIGHHVRGVAPAAQAGLGAAPPPDYHPHIDVNGDGHWDRYTVQGRADGGVDVIADMNRDGRADFIGHDDDRDGLIDTADYDEDRDGSFETHMRDVNGDGWLDTRSVDPQPPRDGTSGVGRHRAPDGEGFGSAR